MTSKNHALAALNRLARLVCTHTGTGQSERILSWLASLYNGNDYPRVDLAWVAGHTDPNVRIDLACVFLSVGTAFPDSQIREALRAAGGDDAVNRLHNRSNTATAHLTLKHLVEWALENPLESHTIRKVLQSLTSNQDSPQHTRVSVDLSQLQHVHSKVRPALLSIIDAAANGYFDQNKKATIPSIISKIKGGTTWLTDSSSPFKKRKPGNPSGAGLSHHTKPQTLKKPQTSHISPRQKTNLKSMKPTILSKQT
jgi:hypothetical protein